MNIEALSNQSVLKVIFTGLLLLPFFLFFSFLDLFCQVTFAFAVQHGLINILTKCCSNIFVVQLEAGIHKTPAIISPKNGNY